MSFGAPIDVNPDDPTQASSGKPARPPDIDRILRDLLNRVEALEKALAQISRQGGGLAFTSPDGNTTKTLSIDNSGNPVWT